MEEFAKALRLAKADNYLYFGILVEMEGFERNELIVNHMENLEAKLEYYAKTYDENLNHKFASGIKIINYAYGDTISEIADELEGDM